MSDSVDKTQRILDLEKRVQHWDPRDRAEAYKEMEALKSREIQHWYCNVGRSCDGKPHKGYEYRHARGDQWPPAGTDWFLWFLMSGRGAGKTRSGSNWIRKVSSKAPRLALVGRRGPDVRQTMIEGPSGLIKACEAAGETYDWKPALREFTFQSGAKAFGFSAEEPDSLRGFESAAVWLDEPSHMPLIEDVWYNLGLGIRVPGLPGGAKALCTSTPLPNKWTKEQIAKPSTRLIRVSTLANIDNLDSAYRANWIDPMIGTRLGRQEIEGQILEDVEGALWHGSMILRSTARVEEMERIVIAIDPAGTSNKRSDETGIVAVGKRGEYGYVLADLSGKYSPKGWADAAIRLYNSLQADSIIVETNFGGDMVRRNLQTAGFDGRIIDGRAVRGKETRAEPVVALYEQQKISHTELFEKLEDEMTTWVPGTGPSPNRVDALVWAFTALFKGGGHAEFVSPRGLSGGNPTLFGTGRNLNPIERLRRERRA